MHHQLNVKCKDLPAAEGPTGLQAHGLVRYLALLLLYGPVRQRGYPCVPKDGASYLMA